MHLMAKFLHILFELQTNGNDNGYVVVSAYPDIENGILEFSDELLPVYESFNLDANDVIILYR